MHRVSAPGPVPAGGGGAGGDAGDVGDGAGGGSSRRVTPWAFLRAGVAGGGAAAGVVAAVPLGTLLFTVLFVRIGPRVVDGIISGAATEGLSGLEAVFAVVMLVVAGVVVAVVVVCALVAPVFVVVPMVVSAVALRLTGAGLVLRTQWLSLAALVVFVAGTAAVLEALDLSARWWVWALVVALAAFAGRLAVEVWEPRRAATRTPTTPSRRWKVLVVVWLCLLALGAVTGTVLFLVVL